MTADQQNIILKLLKLVMNNCIFKFSGTWWLQFIGITMETPVERINTILLFV